MNPYAQEPHLFSKLSLMHDILRQEERHLKITLRFSNNGNHALP